MDLNSAWIFVRVVQTGGFSAAARSLRMPVSTVSTKVSQLEERLGVSLLVRTTRKLQLTEPGTRYFRRALNACSEIEAAEASTQEDKNEDKGLIRITAPVEMGSSSFSDVIADFLKSHPKVQVELLLTDRMVDLIGEGIDLALRVGMLDESSLVAKKIGSTELQLYASPSYLKKHGEPKNAQELKQHDCLNFQGSVTDFWELRVKGKATRVQVKGAVAANNLVSLQRLALRGMGIALLPRFLCLEDEERGRLKHILKECNADQYPIHLVYPPQRYLPRHVRSLMTFIEANLHELF
jgi:DNA-binding transcriptional LysR family regulator